MIGTEDLFNDDLKTVKKIPTDFYKKNKSPALKNKENSISMKTHRVNYPTKTTLLNIQRKFHQT